MATLEVELDDPVVELARAEDEENGKIDPEDEAVEPETEANPAEPRPENLRFYQKKKKRGEKVRKNNATL